MEIKKICILGAGIMGHGIARVCAQKGRASLAERPAKVSINISEG